MRKHFLILMLMALLPLAGWADAVDLPSNLAVTFTYDGSADGNKYTGADIAVAINTAKSGTTDVKTKVVLDGTYADQACTNAVVVKNAGTYYVRVKGDGTNYKADSYKVFPISIAKFGNIEVTAVALPKIYGEAYPTTGFYTATMPTSAPDANAAAAGLVVTPSFSTWPLNKPVGVHGFKIETNSVANYNIVVVDETANLTINKVNLTVKAENKEMEYGSAQPTYTVTYGATLVDGDDDSWTPTFTVKNGTNKTYAQTKGAIGDYTITPGGLTSDNYNFVYETGTLTVNKRNISHVTFVMAGAEYNGENKVTALKAFKTITDETPAVAPAVGPVAADFEVSIFAAETGGSALTTATQAGTYYAAISAAAAGNYTGDAAARIPVVLAQKQLNIISQDASHDYNGVTPALSSANVVFNGLADADKDGVLPAKDAYVVTTYGTAAAAFAAEFTLGLSTADATNAGTYTINTSSKNSTANTAIFKNYKVNYVNVGEMTINKLQVTLQPKDKTIQYGDQEPDWAHATAAMFNIGYETKGGAAATLVAGDEVDEDVFSTMPVIERVVPTGKTAGDVGTYDLNAINYVVVADGNYELKAGEPKKGTLTIEAATSITILVDNVNAVYGEYANQAALETAGKLTYRVSGMKAEDKSKVTVALSVVKAADPTKAFDGKRGTYTIKIGDVTLDESIAANYAGVSITRMDGTLTVGKAPLTLKVLNQSLIADDINGEALAAASEQTVEILTEGLSDADKTALFTTAATKISLKYSAKLVSATDYDATTLVLKSNALTHGWNGSAATTDGIYVNGIEIDATTYNAADVNYTLVLTGEDATVTPGTLYLSNGASVTFDATATGADLVSTKLAANNNKTIGVKVILRRDQTVGGNTVTWSAKQWNTMVLPFDISVADLSEALGYAIVNVVKPEATTGDKVKFQLEMDEIPANTPFAVKTTKAITNGQVIDFGLQTIKYEANPAVDAGADNIFHGAYTSMDITSANPEYRFCAGNVWPHISEAGSKFVVRPFNAYMEIDAANLARDIVFEFEELDGSTTSIKSVDFGSSKAYEADGWYTINGMKLNAAPTEKGIYINNGKKVVVK